jgi:hypothetical protein
MYMVDEAHRMQPSVQLKLTISYWGRAKKVTKPTATAIAQ